MAYPTFYVEAGDTLPIFFDSFDGGTGASITMTGLAVTDIEVYKDGSATQRSSDAGYTLLDTDGIDFDGITGIHGFSLDLGDNTDAGFFAVGSWYHVVVSSVTIDGQTVNFVAAAFRIVSATRGMAGTALPDAAADAAGGLVISDAGAKDFDAMHTAIGTDGTNLTEAGGTGDHLTAINLPNQTMDIVGNITGNLSGSVGSVTGAVGSVTGAVGSVTGAVGSVAGNVDGNVTGSVGSLTGHTNQTADHTANIAAILTDTGTTLDTKLNDIQGATFSAVTDSLEAIRDRGDAAWTTGAGGSDRLLMVDTTIATLASQTSFTLAGGSTDDDAYNNCTIVIEDVSTAAQKAVGLVSDYTGATKTVTLKYDPGIFTMATTDKVYILAENALKSTDANRQLDVTATGAAGIDWSNVENPTTALDLSGTDIQLCDTVTTNSDMRGTDSAALASVCTEARLAELDAANLPADVDSTLADTNELQTDWADGGRLDLILDAAAAVMTTALTEAYGTDGAAMTGAELLYLINAHMGEHSWAGTTKTAKQLDGASTAATFTVNDATTPTSITRAT